MIMRAFIDTSAWHDLVATRATHHAPVREWIAKFSGRLVTSTDVWNETIALLNARYGHKTALQIGENMRDGESVHLVAVEDSIRDEAWQLFKSRADKRYSLTDCTSFVIMRRMDMTQVVTTDDDFRQEGFKVVP